MNDKLKPLPLGTITLADHWTLREAGALNGKLKQSWQDQFDQNPGHRTVVVEIDYHFGERDYSLAAYLCSEKIESGHDMYFKEGRIRMSMSSVEDFFGIAYWFADDWMIENFREQNDDPQDGDRLEVDGEEWFYQDCFPFRRLFDAELVESAVAQDLGPLTVKWLNIVYFLRSPQGRLEWEGLSDEA